jgi:spermidine synthase
MAQDGVTTKDASPAAAVNTDELIPTLAIYLAVGLVAGAIIELQICIMRLFSIGSWAHFGSFVVSLAMMGFGLVSAIMCVAKGWFDRNWKGVATFSLLAFPLLMIGCNLIAQQLPFNAIFIISDPNQTWRLIGNFVLYLIPFLAGALFLGIVFLKAHNSFGRVYFADLTGSGLCGLLFLLALYLYKPENLILAPLVLAFAGCLCWFLAMDQPKAIAASFAVAALALCAHLFLPPMIGIKKLAVSDYKGVSYARKFPDSQRVFERTTPFGYLEVYASSYLHFAPGLSDNAGFNLAKLPQNAYLGLYIDGDGPIGIIRDLPPDETAYYTYLPMIYPYLLKKNPETFVVQFGGGLSTSVAIKNSAKVTVAEGNPAILDAFSNDKTLKDFTGDILHHKNLNVIGYDGRLYLAYTKNKYDVIDLSLADSAGLSNPGGFSIVEKFSYTREAMANYMRALKDGGILSVTMWNKEEPPKSVLKLYNTMVQAARDVDPGKLADSFFATSTYLSTSTVLFKRGGFSPDEIKTLREHSVAMSFDELYSPGYAFDDSKTKDTLKGYQDQIFGNAEPAPADGSAPAPDAGEPAPDAAPAASAEAEVVPATTVGRIAWHYLINGGYDDIAKAYVFDSQPLTNSHPYFAAYVKPADLLKTTDRLDLFQEEWGYLLIWATLGVAMAAAAILVLFPLIFGWRTIFSAVPGKFMSILYFACLGLGYIMVEVGLISNFILALSNATVSASVLITGMLVFSGFGSFVSERYLDRAKTVMPKVFLAIGLILIGYGFFLDSVLDAIGTLPYGLRLAACFALIFPPAFLMGFPMATAMTNLARLGKDHMFLWAWGINGCFSVVGAALVPIVSTLFGLTAVLVVAGCAYLLAIPALFAVLLPMRGAKVAG